MKATHLSRPSTRLCGALSATLLAITVLLLLLASPAMASPAAPAWTITSYSAPTNFAPGDNSEKDVYTITVTNSGGAPTLPGPITITDNLPAPLTFDPNGVFFGYDQSANTQGGESNTVNCEPGPPVTCTDLQDLQPLKPGQSIFMFVSVNTAATAPATVTNEVTVSGGGAPPASGTELTPITGTPALFGFHAFDGPNTEADGSPTTQAGSHPYQTTVNFALNNIVTESAPPAGNAKDLTANLPAGFVVNPQAAAQCTETQLEQEPIACPQASAVGTVGVIVGLNTFPSGQTAPLYDMVAPPGAPAQLAFEVAGLGIFIHLRGQVRTGGDYGLSANANDILQVGNVIGISTTLWGNPSDPSHDPMRGACVLAGGSCPIERANTAFLTMPSACSGPLTTAISADSWQQPGVFLSAEATSPAATGCNQLDFTPTLEAKPTTNVADSPSGLEFDLHFPQQGLEEPEADAEADLKNAVVTFPKGIAVNPASANGLGACSSAQIGLTSAPGVTPITTTPGPATCPDAAKIGSVEVVTPLLDHPLPGGVYVAAPKDNPFGSLLAIYIAVNDPISGVVIKLAGHVEADPVTGQLRASFDETPQLPFEDFKLNFFGGARAALRTPSTCGSYEVTTEMTPWSTPEGADATPSDSFALTQSPGAGACPTSESQLPNKPSFTAGTITPKAGAYSPFVLHLARADGTQEIGSIDTTLPEGLLGKLAGITECSNAQIAQAGARNKLGDGALEKASPSCPLSSEVGTVNVGAGAGPAPYYVSGHAYLAGPYKGAPLSLEVISPAVAGPYDLGSVAVRTALYVNETSAQIHAVSDPFPRILQGIPLDIRSIDLNMNRPNFILNPTSCNAMAVLGSATSTLGSVASLSQRFQVGECNKLGFKPKLALSLKGGTKRNRHPALRSVINYPTKGAYSNIAKAAVTLPASEFIDQAHIGNPCIRPVFAEEKCPKISVLGRAKVWTPLLDQPEEGKVYFRSNGGERELPDLVVALKGQIPLTLVGFVDAVHHKGSEVSRLRTTFATVPDAPVSRFILELKGGKEGLLVNSGNLCKIPNKAVVKLTAQNGKTYDTRPAVGNDCGGKKSKGKHHNASKRPVHLPALGRLAGGW